MVPSGGTGMVAYNRDTREGDVKLTPCIGASLWRLAKGHAKILLMSPASENKNKNIITVLVAVSYGVDVHVV